MPKTKTNSATAKRIRTNSTGQLIARHSGMRHNLRKKTTKQKRILGRSMLVSSADKPRMLKLLS